MLWMYVFQKNEDYLFNLALLILEPIVSQFDSEILNYTQQVAIDRAFQLETT